MAHIKKIKVVTTDYDIDADLLDGMHASDIFVKTAIISCDPVHTTSINPNIFYIFNNAKNLTVNFNTSNAQSGRLNNYMFQITFNGGNTLTLPDNINWANGNSIISEGIEDGGVYQISVINGLGVFSKFN